MVDSNFLKANIWKKEFKFELPLKWIIPMHVVCMIVKYRIGIGFFLLTRISYDERKNIQISQTDRSLSHILNIGYCILRWPMPLYYITFRIQIDSKYIHTHIKTSFYYIYFKLNIYFFLNYWTK